MTDMYAAVMRALRGASKRKPRAKRPAKKMDERTRQLRAAWFRGVTNSRHCWKRRPPRSLRQPWDVEMQFVLYQAYEQATRCRYAGQPIGTLFPPHDFSDIAVVHRDVMAAALAR